jgi:hypothetical protein
MRYFSVLHTYNDIIDFSGNVKLPDSEVSNLRHFCKAHKTRGLKVGDTSAREKRKISNRAE